VITQVAQTQVSVPLIVSRGSIDDQHRVASERSILSLFHEIGFSTYWLSTQQRETAMAAISRYASEADGVRFLEHQYDIALVDAMRELLATKGAQQKKMFFVLHTLGSHFNLMSRYPAQFAVFPDGRKSALLPGSSAWVSQAELINAYDNTILYTDYVLSELVSVLRQRPGLKAMLFVPDHGDNLRDDARGLFGHAHNNEYDLPIPLLFWYSDEYARQFPEKVANARRNAARPINTRVVFYSLADAADAALNDPGLQRLSVFSSELASFKRIALGRPKLFDFDEWMTRTNTKIPVVLPPK
jgi:glucan phosphoethanolaminetransferase (alkaline phosphatase superfamily)